MRKWVRQTLGVHQHLHTLRSPLDVKFRVTAASTGTHLPASLCHLQRSGACVFCISELCIDCQLAGHQRL
jgi:hypothetical protein